MRSRKYDGQSRSIESRLHLAGVRALEPIKGGPKAIQKEMEVIRELVSTLEASIPYIKYVAVSYTHLTLPTICSV